MVCAVEPGSDFSALLERYGVGRAVSFEDARGYFDAAEALASGPRIEAAARVCLDEVFHVRHAWRLSWPTRRWRAAQGAPGRPR